MANKTVLARKDSGPPPRGFWELTLEQLNSIVNGTPRQFKRWVILGLFFLAGALILVVGTAYSVSLLAGHLAESALAASGVVTWLIAATRLRRRKSAKRDRGDETSE